MEAGDLIEIDGVRWVVVRVNRTVADLRNATTDGVRIPAVTPVVTIANPMRDWVHVPIKLNRGKVTGVRKPLPGGLAQTLTPYEAWLDAGAGIYIAPAVGLRRGDVLQIDVGGRVQQVRVRTTDSLSGRIRRAHPAPVAKLQHETTFDWLMRDDDE